jgi:NitT/TauT family transport system ATP-binding protein
MGDTSERRPSVAGAPKLELRDVAKTFAMQRGRVYNALAGVSLTIREGEFVCVVGPSGSGKTTLLSVMAGLTAPSAGEILVDGEPVRGPGRDLGVVFQQDAIFPWRTVIRNVEYGLEVAGVPKQERRERIQRYIELVGLEEFVDFFPKELSGGMKKRVALATVFANDPAVLFMDEPFGSLDYSSKAALQHELLKIWSMTRKTTVFVTHDVEEAVFLADRVLVIRDGLVHRDFPVALPRPRTEETRASAELSDLRRQLLHIVESPPDRSLSAA